MKSDINYTLVKAIDAIIRITDKAKGCKLDPKLWRQINQDLKVIAGLFSITQKQAFFLSLIFYLDLNKNYVRYDKIADFLDCNPIHLVKYYPEVDKLITYGIIEVEEKENNPKDSVFVLPSIVCKSIMVNTSFKRSKNNHKETTIFDVVQSVHEIGCKVQKNKLERYELVIELQQLLDKHNHFPIIARIKDLKLSIDDAYVLLDVSHHCITGDWGMPLNSVTEALYPSFNSKLEYMKNFVNESNILIKNEYIEVEDTDFLNDTSLNLTEKSMKLLVGDDYKYFMRKTQSNTIQAISIQSKQLFFNSLNEKQINNLFEMLEDVSFLKIQSRLKEKNLPVGVTILLYGEPGTGKTESVYQIAKKTNRDIIHIDISQTKTKWFGESEKLVKAIFTNYQKELRSNKLAPILLFNEADAVISSRFDNISQSTDQTMNRIQNILLEEFEKFNGILVATTNKPTNFDSAFDRRFLYKVEYTKPQEEVKAKIWKSKIESLNDETCLKLAKGFNFSGGQIDNITRKFLTHEIIKGTIPDEKMLIEYCKEETLKNVSSIGFSKH